MTSTLAARWPSALGVAGATGFIAIIIVFGAESMFAALVAAMAAMYMVAYAVGRPVAVWLAFPALSIVVGVMTALKINLAVGMTVVLIGLWLWTLIAGRASDGRLFTVQTLGMVAFGAITLATVAVDQRVGGALAGIGFLAHGIWDIAHFRANKVVNRPWSEFCAVVDVPVGLALIISALIQ